MSVTDKEIEQAVGYSFEDERVPMVRALIEREVKLAWLEGKMDTCIEARQFWGLRDDQHLMVDRLHLRLAEQHAALDELVYGNARAMHELVALRVELDKLRARVVDSDLERGRISQQAAEMKECAWAQEPDGGPWQTSCGNEFELIDGTPRDNGIAYCCYCGGSLEQIEYTGEAERAAIAAAPTEEA